MTPETINGMFAIAGAIIGAVVAGLFAWLLQAKYRSKKELKVLISKPKSLVDIHDTLKGMVSINISGNEVDAVVNVDYYMLNSGNEVLNDIVVLFEFDDEVTILGGNCPSLNFNAKKVEEFAMHIEERNRCEIRASYINPGEEARGHLTLDKIPIKTDVSFRQPGVLFRLAKNYDSARNSMITDVLYEAAKSNFILDSYLKLALPAYREHRKKTASNNAN